MADATLTPTIDEIGLIFQRPDELVSYIMFFDGHGAYSPDGLLPGITKEQADKHNAVFDKMNLEGLDNAKIGEGGQGFYLSADRKKVTTFVGTSVGDVTGRGRKKTLQRGSHVYSLREDTGKDPGDHVFLVRIQ